MINSINGQSLHNNIDNKNSFDFEKYYQVFNKLKETWKGQSIIPAQFIAQLEENLAKVQIYNRKDNFRMICFGCGDPQYAGKRCPKPECQNLQIARMKSTKKRSFKHITDSNDGGQSQVNLVAVDLVSLQTFNLLDGHNVTNDSVLDNIPWRDSVGNPLDKLPVPPSHGADYMLIDSGANCLLIVRSDENLKEVKNCNTNIKSYGDNTIKMDKIGKFLECTSYVYYDANVQVFGPNIWLMAMHDMGISASATTSVDSTATFKLSIDNNLILTAAIHRDGFIWYPRNKLMEILGNSLLEIHKKRNEQQVRHTYINLNYDYSTKSNITDDMELSNTQEDLQVNVATRKNPRITWNSKHIPNNMMDENDIGKQEQKEQPNDNNDISHDNDDASTSDNPSQNNDILYPPITLNNNNNNATDFHAANAPTADETLPSSITNRQETDTKENDQSNTITSSSKNNTTGVSTEERVLLEEGVAIDLDSEEVTINLDDDVPNLNNYSKLELKRAAEVRNWQRFFFAPGYESFKNTITRSKGLCDSRKPYTAADIQNTTTIYGDDVTKLLTSVRKSRTDSKASKPLEARYPGHILHLDEKEIGKINKTYIGVLHAVDSLTKLQFGVLMVGSPGLTEFEYKRALQQILGFYRSLYLVNGDSETKVGLIIRTDALSLINQDAFKTALNGTNATLTTGNFGNSQLFQSQTNYSERKTEACLQQAMDSFNYVKETLPVHIPIILEALIYIAVLSVRNLIIRKMK